MKLQNDLGEIRISSEVFTAVTGSAATNCYGVKGMAVRSTTDGLVHLLKRESMAKGVKVYYNDDGTVAIELHIIVENGVNLTAVCHSIMSQVRYVVSSTTGVDVSTVDVYVDSVRFYPSVERNNANYDSDDRRGGISASGHPRLRRHQCPEAGHQRPECVPRP